MFPRVNVARAVESAVAAVRNIRRTLNDFQRSRALIVKFGLLIRRVEIKERTIQKTGVITYVKQGFDIFWNFTRYLSSIGCMCVLDFLSMTLVFDL